MEGSSVIHSDQTIPSGVMSSATSSLELEESLLNLSCSSDFDVDYEQEIDHA